MGHSLRCPHCGEIDWERAPELRQTLTFIQKRGETVNQDVRRAFRLSPSNASNRLAMLERLNLIVRVRTEGVKRGGLQAVYLPIIGGTAADASKERKDA